MNIQSSNTKKPDISPHKWQNRLVLILTENPNSEIYLDQIRDFKENKEGLLERKLIIYQIQPGGYQIDMNSKDWHPSTSFYDHYKKTSQPFELYLIGLDGSVKLHQTDRLPCKDLFAIIDGMPMRQIELKAE